jgi:hypothetical protein
LTIDKFTAKPKSHITILGKKEQLKWHQNGKQLVIDIPPALQNKPIGDYAVAFKISK